MIRDIQTGFRGQSLRQRSDVLPYHGNVVACTTGPREMVRNDRQAMHYLPRSGS
jgi:hypothetical protein